MHPLEYTCLLTGTSLVPEKFRACKSNGYYILIQLLVKCEIYPWITHVPRKSDSLHLDRIAESPKYPFTLYPSHCKATWRYAALANSTLHCFVAIQKFIQVLVAITLAAGTKSFTEFSVLSIEYCHSVPSTPLLCNHLNSCAPCIMIKNLCLPTLPAPYPSFTSNQCIYFILAPSHCRLHIQMHVSMECKWCRKAK